LGEANNLKSLSIVLSAILFFVLAACAPTAQDTSSVTTLILSGENEVPAVMTAGMGIASATVSGNMMTISGEFTGLNSPLVEVAGSSGHVHQAAAGSNGNVVFPLDVTSTDGRNGTFSLGIELTRGQMSAFNAGKFYINLHTRMNPEGELRGQIVPQG
jgi:hypothetical protein